MIERNNNQRENKFTVHSSKIEFLLMSLLDNLILEGIGQQQILSCFLDGATHRNLLRILTLPGQVAQLVGASTYKPKISGLISGQVHRGGNQKMFHSCITVSLSPSVSKINKKHPQVRIFFKKKKKRTLILCYLLPVFLIPSLQTLEQMGCPRGPQPGVGTVEEQK